MIKVRLGSPASILLATVILAFSGGVLSYGQSASGAIRGTVLDPSGSAIAGATVEISNPVSHYQQSVKTSAQGAFQFANIPYNNYHLTANASGFQERRAGRGCAVGCGGRCHAHAAGRCFDHQRNGGKFLVDLVETDSTTPHTDVDRNLIDKLPLESQSSSLSSLVTLASPGVSADSNGLFHGLGDHAQNSFSIDGQPISDQQSKVFSNQIPSDAVQSMEVIEGCAAAPNTAIRPAW